MKHCILMIATSFSPNIGGLETHLDDLCEYLCGSGHRVFVVTHQPITTRAKGPKVERRGNLEIHRINWFGYNWFHRLEAYPPLLLLYLFPGLFIGSFFFLLRHRREVDVIHAQGLICAFITRLLTKIFHKRSVMSTHTIFDPLYNFQKRTVLCKVIKWTLASFDVIMPLAKKGKDELIAIGVPAQKVTTFTYWVNLDRFRPLSGTDCKAKLGLERKFVALFLGRFIRKKGMDILLEAAPKVNPNITFAFVGDGPLANRIKEQAKVQPNVVFFGKVPNEETPKYFNAADMFVISSQYEEGFGRVVIEALACGIPILAANKGGIPEAVDSSVAVLIEPSAENIARQLSFFYHHPSRLAKLKANCRPYAQAHFSTKNAETIEKAYNATE